MAEKAEKIKRKPTPRRTTLSSRVVESLRGKVRIILAVNGSDKKETRTESLSSFLSFRNPRTA